MHLGWGSGLCSSGAVHRSRHGAAVVWLPDQRFDRGFLCRIESAIGCALFWEKENSAIMNKPIAPGNCDDTDATGSCPTGVG